MGTLYECLREARLERYYPTFRANGITRSEALGQLSMHECVAMGITSSEDRRRMTELINIIKSVHGNGNNNNNPSTSQSQRAQYMPAPRKRNRSPAQAVSHSARALEPVQGATAAERVPNFSAASYMDMLDMASDSPPDDDDDASSESEHSDYEPASKFSSKSNRRPATAAPSRPMPAIDRGNIRRKNKGYNYGVPTAAASSGTRPKTRSSQGSSRGGHGEEKIRVCVRKRPLNRREMRAKDVDLVTVRSTTTMIVSEPKQAVDLSAYTLEHEFIFDEVFDANCSNEDVYVRAARPLISCVFNGGKATCFAYGQTGAGKTHTMMGNPEVPGLYLLAAYDIFAILESGQYGSGLKVWVSFFEIYCGQLFDLLNRRNRLHAREDGSHQVCIAGLTETEVKDVDALVQVLDYGNSVRSKGATGVNPDSSRSHAVLQLEIRRPSDQKLGRMSFIDLAGSERASDVTDTDRQTRMEGAEINQSLLALKECIRSIDQESRHTPFRQSKLTHILKDSFVGNSRTCMIANISPAQCACEHTLNTLRYADRVKELRREGGGGNRGASSSSQDMNLLMNIPITAPSVFHPSHLHTSTPVRPSASRQARRPVEPQFDPSETPIRGHNIQRKTAARGPTAKSGGRGGSGRVLPARPAAARDFPAAHSPSESDLTDTDSCNLTLPKPLALAQVNIPVVRSTDTDNDFPTSDFNIPEELNDLNRPPVKGEASGKKGSPGSAKERDGEAGPARDSDAASASSVSKAPARGDVTPSGASGRPFGGPGTVAPVAERAAVFNPTVKCWTDDGGMAAVPSPGHSGSPRRRLPMMAGTAPASGPSTPDVSVIGHVPAEVSVSVPYSAHSIPVSEHNESFEDDLLFDAGPAETRPAASSSQPPRDPPQGLVRAPPPPPPPETVTKTTLSVGPMQGQFGVIPAVLPAESSDLTSIAQRSPLRDNGIQSGARMVTQSPEPKAALAPYALQPDAGAGAGGRRGSQSPSSEASDDSMEGVKSSFSDQGQGPYKQRGGRSDLRKEKSDPMLALHMQQKKQTLPKPQEFLKYLSRGGTPKGTPSLRGASPLAVPSGQDVPAAMHHPTGGSEPNSLEQRDAEPNAGRGATGQALPEPPHLSRPDLPRPVREGSPSSAGDSRHRQSRQRTSPSPVRAMSGEETREERRRRRRRSHSGSGHSDDNAPASRADSLEEEGKSSLPTKLPGTETSSASVPASSSSNNVLVKKIADALQDTRQQQTTTHVVMTEKLSTGAVFSPIHPQPLTSQPVTRSTIVTRDLLQPKPVTPLWNSVSVDPPTPTSLDKARSDLINSHEMQLANVTSMCKQEMKLLLNAKGGHKSFEDYLRRVGDVLSQKMAAIQLLQDQISAYWVTAPPSSSSATTSSAAVSASMVSSSLSTQQSFNIPP